MLRLIRAMLLVLLFSGVLFSEEIQLKDGTKITGTLISISGEVFHVRTAYGEIQIPRSQIVAISFQDKAASDSHTGPNSQVFDECLDGAKYTNRTAHFSVVLEAGWRAAPELRSRSQDVAAAFRSDDQTLFFMVTPEKFAGNLATYEVLVETQVKTKFKDYKKLSESQAKLDNREAARIMFQATTLDSNIGMKFLVYILPYEGRMVRLSFFTLDPLFDGALTTFEKIAGSYRSFGNESIAFLNPAVATRK